MSPLLKLRLAFTGLGAALLLAVFGLLDSALSRLEEQRLFRHRMVAERVFDEAERELSSLLQHEAERPDAAYDAVETDPGRWGRFVIGYYRREPAVQVVAEGRLDQTRANQIRSAVSAAQPQLDAGDPTHGGTRALPPADEELVANRSPDVLRQLNRSVKVRERRQQDLSLTFTVVQANADTLVVEREGDGRREGFVLSVPELVATIQSWVLSAQGLDAVATLTVLDEAHAPDPAAPRNKAGGYDFAHQLAAPLDSQHIALHLSRLDDEDATSTLYGLALLLATAAVLGLWSIYRMVAVQIRFAERRNNFVAAVTHELRTPLTSIRMYGEMLRDGMVQDEGTRQEYYATITSEGERLTRLINNVMEHGQLRRGQRHAHLEKCDVTVVVREVVDLMRPHVEREGSSVTLTIEAPVPLANVDVDALKQVLFNVIDNALKYGRGADSQTNASGAQIQIACGATATGDVLLRIRDHGNGIADGQQHAVFEPFFRGENELTRRHKGTGLGLALVHDLVTLMHGTVHGDNRNPGFEITIELPAAA